MKYILCCLLLLTIVGCSCNYSVDITSNGVCIVGRTPVPTDNLLYSYIFMGGTITNTTSEVITIVHYDNSLNLGSEDLPGRYTTFILKPKESRSIAFSGLDSIEIKRLDGINSAIKLSPTKEYQ